MDIARYCCFDVKVTRDVHWYGAEHGFIRYDDKRAARWNCPWIGNCNFSCMHPGQL